MNELSLFSGSGGGVLGTKLLGWKTIGYVEYEKYCQKILKQRIADGILDAAPIFGDIRRFISEGYAESYQGMVDVVTAGFPCQPFSVAGKGEGENDPRNMWPQTIECIRLVRPRYALLENVPGLLVHRYMGRIFGDLAEAGDDAKWCVLGADDCGAPHRRKRLWIMAYSGHDVGVELEKPGNNGSAGRHGTKGADTARKSERSDIGNGRTEDMAYANERRSQPRSDDAGREKGSVFDRRCEGSDVANSQIERVEGGRPEGEQKSEIHVGEGSSVRDSGRSGWWTTDPADGAAQSELGRVAHGVAHRVDRLKAIGNGQVPIVAATAWRLLSASS